MQLGPRLPYVPKLNGPDRVAAAGKARKAKAQVVKRTKNGVFTLNDQLRVPWLGTESIEAAQDILPSQIDAATGDDEVMTCFIEIYKFGSKCHQSDCNMRANRWFS